MKVCLICVEIFAWGKYGGFGRSTRVLGRELARRGIQVYAVVPRREGQKPVEQLDGITVLGFPPLFPWSARRLYRECDADIYHSQEPSFGTHLAMKAMPDRRHVITFRDPRNRADRRIEMRYPSRNRFRTYLADLYENAVVRNSASKADQLFCCSRELAFKVRDLFDLPSVPSFLPSPIKVPDRPMKKSARPMVCFVARLDRRKRPEVFFNLARAFPDVRFVAVGMSQDRKRDEDLRRRYGGIPNLEMAGFIDQFETDALSRLMEESWILVNTAAREGLPTTFLEAMAHRCAILSAVNPDDIAGRFGHHVNDGDFAAGLKALLDGDTWIAKGEAGYRYVREEFDLKRAVDRHVAIYDGLIKATDKKGETAPGGIKPVDHRIP
jgi:glycosyltransferase involved in cell wall biosynthesis